MYLYTWYQWLMFFFIYCFIGWIIESTYVSIKSLQLVNRGFLRLPLLPLYGSGAIVMLWLSLPVKGNLLLVFLFGMTGASALEYVTGYVMERLFKMKYWDYSNNPLNLNGYICLGTSIAWGFLTMLLTEVVHRPLEWLVLDLNPTACISVVLVTSVLFVTDTIHSTKEALDLGRVLESMTKLKAELEEVQLQMNLLKAETAQKVSELKNETLQKTAALKDETLVKISSIKAETANALKESSLAEHFQSLTESALTGRLQSLAESREKLTNRLTAYRKGILRRNPTASSRLFGEALRELRELKEYSKKRKKS
ncbi:MAG: putative ABC transporter permease [Lacrimispora sp.]